jgi:hypothetical protein
VDSVSPSLPPVAGRRSLVARYGDAWPLATATYSDTTSECTREAVRAQSARLDELCRAVGRDQKGTAQDLPNGNTDERSLSRVDEFVEFAGRYREMGLPI